MPSRKSYSRFGVIIECPSNLEGSEREGRKRTNLLAGPVETDLRKCAETYPTVVVFGCTKGRGSVLFLVRNRGMWSTLLVIDVLTCPAFFPRYARRFPYLSFLSLFPRIFVPPFFSSLSRKHPAVLLTVNEKKKKKERKRESICNARPPILQAKPMKYFYNYPSAINRSLTQVS